MATSGDGHQNMVFWIFNYSCCVERKEHYRWFRFNAADESMIMFDDSESSASYLNRNCVDGGVSVGCFIYVVGHAEENKRKNVNRWVKGPSKHIYRLDTTNFEKGWKKLDVELSSEKETPYMVELDGKIYIFEYLDKYGNSCSTPPPEPSEVYDPVQGTIQVVPQEMYTPKLILLGVDHHCKQIVFFSNRDAKLALYSPYKEHNKWELIKIPCEDALLKLRTYVLLIRAIHNKTLYWVDMDTHSLYGYSFEYNKISDPVYMGFVSNFENLIISKSRYVFNYPELLHVNGDRFCMFWYRELVIDEEFNNLNCTSIAISNRHNDVDGSFVLNVSELATHTCSVPAPARCYHINNIVPMRFSNSKAAGIWI